MDTHARGNGEGVGVSNFDLEPMFKIYSIESRGAAITVRMWPEAPTDSIEICTTDDADKEWFGEFSLPLPKEGAVKLATALMEMAEKMDDK